MTSTWRERHAPALAEARNSARVFLKDKLALAGLVWIVVTISVALLAPFVAPYPEQGRGASDIPNRLQAPSVQHPFGTDDAGRDVLSRVVFGARIAIVMPFFVMVGVALIGIPLGGIAGYFGGLVDETIMRVTDLFLAFPGLILAMALVAFLGASLRNVGIALVITW